MRCHAAVVTVALLIATAAGRGVLAASRPEQPPIRAWTTHVDGAISTRAAALDGLHAGGSVILPIDGIEVSGTVEAVRVRAGRRVARGNLAGGGEFILARSGDALAGYVRSVKHGAWHLRTDRGTTRLVRRPDDGFECHAGDAEPQPHDAAAGGVAGAGCDSQTSLDVVVAYTIDARLEWGGASAIEAEIELMIEYANDAFDNSQVFTVLNLVHIEELDATGFISLSPLTNTSDGVVDEVHDLRDAYAADLLVLVNSGTGGAANGLASLSPGLENEAFCWAGIASTPDVIAHEIGHQLGGCHAPGDGGGCPIGGGLLYPYSSGYRFFGDSGEQWRTVMAYAPGMRIPHFSHPGINYDGQATGIPIGAEGEANNSATFNDATPIVANFRCRDETCTSLGLGSQAEDCDDSGLPDLCEIALGWLDDDNGNGVPDICDPPPPSNNTCGQAQFMVEGAQPFTTLFATSDGPDEAACGPIETDVWFRVFSQCDDELTVSVCDADFTPAIAAYGSQCPTGPNTASVCSAVGCAGGVQLSFDAASSTVYRIRVGSIDGSTGTGMFKVTCGLPPDCAEDTDGSGAVDVDDLVNVIIDWNTDGSANNTDVDGSGVVDVDDLVAVILAWGACGG